MTARMPRISRGVAAIEMALLAIPLAIMTFGMEEAGRAFYYYNGLLKSTREAARYLSTQPPGSGEAVAKCLAVYGRAVADCSGGALEPLVPGLTTAMVTVTPGVLPLGGGYGSVNIVTVTVGGYPFNSAVELAFPDVTFGPVATTMRRATS